MDNIAIATVVAVVVVVAAYFYFKSPGGGPVSSTVLQTNIVDGRKEFTSKQAIPKSLDQPEGLTFSYTCWVKIDDFSYRLGQQKVVFTKGPVENPCPALLVDSNTNTLLVKLQTYGATEVIPIPNIPAKKWIHVAIAVDQDSVDVYINGTLFIHHTLVNVPKQNTSSVQIGQGGGFDGKVSNLEYYSYFMRPADVQKSMATRPTVDPNDIGGPTPPYFDMSWWVGRRS